MQPTTITQDIENEFDKFQPDYHWIKEQIEKLKQFCDQQIQQRP